MSDSFTETTSTSWFKRVGRSIVGVLVGLLLVILMVIGLFWNEGRAVTTARSLAEGATAVVSIADDTVEAANEGRLVHVSGPVTTDTVPADPDFGVSAKGIRLDRGVEMFQWRENSKSETTTKIGGGEETVTTYTYVKAWDDQPIDSSAFRKPDGHANPPMEIREKSYQVPQASLGAFTLDRPVLDEMGGEQPLAVSTDRKAAIAQAYAGEEKVSIVDGRIYLGANPTKPVIGDYRISYDVVPLGDFSIVARQKGPGFVPYQTKAGDALLMVRNGTVPADQMFADAVSENTLITWLLRAAGLVLLFIGFAMVMGPVGVLLDVIPFLGGIARFGTGIVAFVLAVLVGTATIALAWLFYRPLLSFGILAVGLIIAAVTVHLGRARARAPAAPAQPKFGRPAAGS